MYENTNMTCFFVKSILLCLVFEHVHTVIEFSSVVGFVHTFKWS